MSHQPGYGPPPMANEVAVIGPQYCAPYPVDLTVTKKVMTIKEGNFAVSDVNGNIIFKVKGAIFSIRDRRVLLDAAGNPLVSMQQKMHRKHSVQSIVFGKDTFRVTVYPHVDHAFITSLIVILNEINEDRSGED
ncbi:hypothetical protein GIB67_020248 [Kingdonia uniflora]|uniref:Uncharacterized protein n=1 Tax=Kingdonia uniflora TaxID=39325 RepID=A0A7J7P3P5_9MAGN|nr:hypothetical protein GIB67_020248 [Kingdonia uniflora]